MNHLFSPLTVRDITLRNRIGVSPMCQYSCNDGMTDAWHMVHLGSRAVGGAALVIMEATAVVPEGRISPEDAGLWSDAQIEPLSRLCEFLHSVGSVAGIQLAHAGRKASTRRPWAPPLAADAPQPRSHVPAGAGGWQPVAPSAIAFAEDYVQPTAMTLADIKACQTAFQSAARRALRAGFKWLELHAAHGYLMHSFLSPLSNARTDAYGGSLANRCRFVCETVEAVRAVWPANLPLAIRFSASDWVDGGWALDDSVALAKQIKSLGVDLIDCSSGGLVPQARIPVGSSYQVHFAEAIRKGANIPTAAVGCITDPAQADDIVRCGRADLVLLARALLRDPYWPWHAARALHQTDALKIPPQYGRA